MNFSPIKGRNVSTFTEITKLEMLLARRGLGRQKNTGKEERKGGMADSRTRCCWKLRMLDKGQSQEQPCQCHCTTKRPSAVGTSAWTQNKQTLP